jgi:hypothetical protein
MNILQNGDRIIYGVVPTKRSLKRSLNMMLPVSPFLPGTLSFFHGGHYE